jgi:hypothetical protein
VLTQAIAVVKPDERVVCRRCPNGDWVETFKDGSYGTDTELRCYCAGLGGTWSWPKYNIGACQVRIRAINAERRNDNEG